jgi:hypothetical protein
LEVLEQLSGDGFEHAVELIRLEAGGELRVDRGE